MIKGTTTIKADDTTSAMEKVVSQLGEDCVILSTKKKNGKIEITASNSPKHKSSVKKRYDKKKCVQLLSHFLPFRCTHIDFLEIQVLGDTQLLLIILGNLSLRQCRYQ